MLLVKTSLRPSPIHGFGLFADEFIPRGTVVWRFVPGFDARLSREAVDALHPVARAFWEHYGYLSEVSGEHVMCLDDARFYNHSDDPNTDGIELDDTDGEGGDVATRDIHPGDEITYDYRVGDMAWREKGIRP